MSVSIPATPLEPLPAATVVVGKQRRMVELDGLRAVLCLMLFGLHANVAFLRAGWLAVDSFFVLSGFLITTLLLKELGKHGRIDMIRFLTSRTLRLFPVLVLAVGFTGVLYVTLGVHSPGERPLLKSAITTLTYTQNLVVAQHPGVPDPFPQTWSLAQEQQFYLLWPLLLGFLTLRAGKWVLPTVLGIASLSALLLLLTSHGPTPASYFWPWTRSSGLALGAALALALTSRTLQEPLIRLLKRRGTGVLALVAFVVPFAVLPHLGLGTAGVLFTGVTAVTLTSGLLVGHLVTATGGLPNGFLRLPPLVHLGRWSYAFYLIHLPLLIVLRERLDHTAALWLALVLSVALSALVHHTVERPLDRLRHRLFAL